MHQVIVDGLEQFLAGADPNDPAQRDFDKHLERCEACRLEVREFRELSSLFVSLRAAEEIQPAPGFYGRLSRQIDNRAPASFWRLFSLDPAFGRRVAFASLMFLAVLGSYLVSQDSDVAYAPPNPETVMAIEQNSPAVDSAPASDREMMLVTLTSYRP